MANNPSIYEFAGCDTVSLAKEFGTPLYVVSEDKIIDKCHQVKEAFIDKYPNTKAAYASKAFLTMAMCKIVEREGLGLDVVSGGELYTAIRANFPMEKVMFHGNNKSYDELLLAIEHGVGRIIVDNFFELDMLTCIAEQKQKHVDILFRVAPGIGGKTHEYISTGQTDSKFGICLEGNNVETAVKQAMGSRHVDLKGFHFHVGSQLFDIHGYLSSLQIVLRIMRDLKNNLDFFTEELNIGGGFGINYTEQDQETKPLCFFLDPIMENIKVGCQLANLDMPTIIIEPGRWIVGEAGITLYTIGAIKEIPSIRTYASIDGGFPDNPRPALYQARYSAVVANKADQARDKTVTIAGKCCESGDVLIRDLKVPNIDSGDILAVFSTGAYNYSMASNYNRLPRPAVVLISDSKPRLIVEREQYHHLLDREIMPDHLKIG